MVSNMDKFNRQEWAGIVYSLGVAAEVEKILSVKMEILDIQEKAVNVLIRTEE